MFTASSAENRKVEAWFRFLGSDKDAETKIQANLTSAGVHLYTIESSQGNHHGIACLSELDDKALTSLREICENHPSRVIALVTSPVAVPSSRCWEMIKAGASDSIIWQEHDAAAKQIYAKLERWITTDELVGRGITELGLIGQSSSWVTLLRAVAEAAHFTDIPILLMGDSGTGKELLANLIHLVGVCRSERAGQRELITVDCSTIVPELSGSELFGHERGAFTHAISSREGALALADGGTLFLDEVGELPLLLQAQLLRAVQEKSYKKVGSNVWHRTDFRLVCATNRDLAGQVEKGQFRLDLYHRIAGWIFRTVPLNQRRQDIIPLAAHFLRTSVARGPVPDFDSAVRDYLVNRDYPGNVRELFQLVRRIGNRHVGQWPITVGDIPPQDVVQVGTPLAWPDEDLVTSISNALTLGIGLRKINQVTTDTAIRLALRSEDNNLPRAARRLGVTDRALQKRRASAKVRSEFRAA
jgi:transcriptional regulator with GAF, ATPase, and Fis domain